MVILFDQYHLSENVYEVIFATEQQVTVAKMLVDFIKKNGGSIGKTEMSVFATNLHEGTVIEQTEEIGPVTRSLKTNFSYNKRQFYDRILTPLKSMGLIDYDMYKKKYRLSERFQKAISKIGMMWLQELKRPVDNNDFI